MPPTSVASERVFSKVGLTLANKLRNRFVCLFMPLILWFRLTSKKVREIALVAFNSMENCQLDDMISEEELLEEILETSENEMVDSNVNEEAVEVRDEDEMIW